MGSCRELEGSFLAVGLRCLLEARCSQSCPDLLLLLFVKLTNTEAGALLWDATRERKPEVSELVGCSAEHIQTFVQHVSPPLAG